MIEDRRGKTIFGLVLKTYLGNQLLKEDSVIKTDSVWIDELSEETTAEYAEAYQPKHKVQWKREINPRKH